MKRHEASAFIVSPGMAGSTELREPVRAATVESEVLVPLMQGGAVALLLVAFVADVAFVPLPWSALLGLGLFVLLALSVLMFYDGRRLLWRVERTLGADLDGDAYAGPPQEPQMFRIELHERTPAGQRTAWLDVPGPPERFALLAQSALNDGTLSEARWTGAGNPYSRAEFAALRDTMLDRGLWEWTNVKAKAQGLRVTHAGRAVLRSWLEAWGKIERT